MYRNVRILYKDNLSSTVVKSSKHHRSTYMGTRDVTSRFSPPEGMLNAMLEELEFISGIDECNVTHLSVGVLADFYICLLFSPDTLDEVTTLLPIGTPAMVH